MLRLGHNFFGIHIVALKDSRIFSSSLKKGQVKVGEQSVPSIIIPIFYIKYKNDNYRVHLVLLRFSARKLLDAPIHNSITISYIINGKDFVNLPLKFNSILFSLTKKQFIGPKWISNDAKKSIYVRTSMNGRYYVTVREINKTDYFTESIKITLAFLTYVISKSFTSRTTLLYEKKCSKYEESASVLFEKMQDLGIRNTKYVLSSDAIKSKVPDEYRKNIVERHTLKHYYHFFNSDVLISTEAPGHSIDLRVANFLATNKIMQKKYKYVFLQHGVMYMVSLASVTRKPFRKGGIYPLNTKIVVSSITEAKHFIEDGKYCVDDLYITGLPKFDRLKWSSSADRIVIMPTWRPWEYNEIASNCQGTGYYNIIAEIISSIPKSLLHRVQVLPHPLFSESFVNTPLQSYIQTNVDYDYVMQNAAVLITDYSSIAYDMFARGGKVIFWWKDKDYCMEMYQGHLKLNSTNCFGDIVYVGEELSDSLVQALKTKERSDIQEKKFRELVFDFDRNSSYKLIERLIEDGYIRQ